MRGKTNTLWVLSCVWVLVGLSTVATAQQKNRQQLEREKQKNLQEITEINEILDKTTSEKKVSVGQLRAINRRIEIQTKQIDLISDDLSLLDRELKDLTEVTTGLSNDLQRLRKEYAAMIYSAAKMSNTYSQLSFLFSATSFNDLIVRYKYLQQYSDARKAQVRQIEQVRVNLLAQQNAIKNKKQQQQQTLSSQVVENRKLGELKEKQAETVAQLSQQELKLKAELEEKKRSMRQLDRLITTLIEREIRESRRREEERIKAERAERLAKAKAAKEAKEKENTAPTAASTKPAPEAPASEKEEVREMPASGMAMNEVETSLAASFAANRNRLPWPVLKGFISEKFGIHYDPDFPQVKYENMGVDIQTTVGESVRSVFDGTVLTVDDHVPGMGNVVVIQHGNFMTVYAKLGNVNVKEGQKVKAREAIGVVAPGREGPAEINFQVWKNTTKLDPETWLQHR